MDAVEIDGSFGEGGGQILRTSLALSAITQRAVKIFNIRAKRKKGGLQPQHLMSCLAVKQISQGSLEGAEIGSHDLYFTPGNIQAGNYLFDVQTAGAATLVAQTIIPVLLAAESFSEVCIIGGTHLPKSPSFDFLEKVFIPAIARFGAQVHSEIKRPGYYPAGGGEIKIRVQPSVLSGNTDWKFEDCLHAKIRISNLPRHIADREAKVLKENGIAEIQIMEENAYSTANSLTVWRGFCGVSILGERGKPAEAVAKEAALLIKEEIEEVDMHLADQLLLYAALGKGKTCFTTTTITPHLMTNIAVIQKFLAREIKTNANSVEIF